MTSKQRDPGAKDANRKSKANSIENGADLR